MARTTHFCCDTYVAGPRGSLAVGEHKEAKTADEAVRRAERMAEKPPNVGALRAARVELLVDVRAVAASRRAGFSKSALRASVEKAGLGYLHLRDLGTPKTGRDAARAGADARRYARSSARG